MSDVVTTWAGYIDPGALISDADGAQWRVVDRRVSLPQVALCITNGAETHWMTKKFDDDIVLIDETHGKAVLNVMNALEGKMIVEPLPKGPDKKSVRALYAAHLKHHHKVWVEGTGSNVNGEHTLQGLIELHALEHASPRPDWVPHEHGEV